jgi:flagellar biogenesis protein FliO
MKTSPSRKSNPITGDALPLPDLGNEASLSTLRSHTGLFSRAWGWLQARHVSRSSSRRLRVAETVSLGEKRFVAVVQVDGRHFLLAGGPTNIVLLAHLNAKDAFEDVLKETLADPGKKQVARRKRQANFDMQGQVNRTNNRENLPQQATIGRRQSAKRAGKQSGFEHGPASAPPITHLNGTDDFGDVLQKTMSAGREPGSRASKNSTSTALQTGYYA